MTPTSGKPHLFSALEDVAPGGESTLIAKQIAAMKTKDTGQTNVEFDLIGVRHTVPSGHTLHLHLTLNDDSLAGLEPLAEQSDPLLRTAFTDGLYIDATRPAGLAIHHSSGRNSMLTVTTKG